MSVNIQDKHPDLPLFLIGHSMGGMIALRAVLRHPGFFTGMILNGPLIVPGPQVQQTHREQQPSYLLPGRSHRLQIHSIPDICLQGSVAASELGHSSRSHWPAKHEYHNQVHMRYGCY